MTNDPTHDTPPQQLRRTPLYAVHAAAGANLVPFGGWEMPLHYGSQIQEHHATRRGCGLFDVSHMGQIEVRGAGAQALLQCLVTRGLHRLHDGDVAYSVLCNERGGLIDDLMVGRLSAERWFLVVNAATDDGDFAHMSLVAEAEEIADAELLHCSGQWAMVAVQGPRWREVLAGALGDGPWLGLPPMKIIAFERDGAEWVISSTGYTGEPGVEIMCPPAAAPALWQALIAAGGTPVGLAARDSLRMEKGFSLSGQDFTTAHHPLEAGLAWVVDFTQDFVGADALREIKLAGAGRKDHGRRFVGLQPEGRRIARHGAAILHEGRVVGEVTSGGFSPTLERPIALGYIDAALAAPGTQVQVDLGRGTTTPATVCARKMV